MKGPNGSQVGERDLLNADQTQRQGDQVSAESMPGIKGESQPRTLKQGEASPFVSGCLLVLFPASMFSGSSRDSRDSEPIFVLQACCR